LQAQPRGIPSVDVCVHGRVTLKPLSLVLMRPCETGNMTGAPG
jgi:hypothetical protein